MNLLRKLSVTYTLTDDNLDSAPPLEAARSLHRSAVEDLLRRHYSRVCRIALGLCGRESCGRAAVRTVMQQSVRMLPNWQRTEQADNWFLHHTVLAARQQSSRVISEERDCLAQRAESPATEYLAFLRVLRHLPQQQREAVVLSRGEKLDIRQIAIAMDCSTTAVANHLIAANKTLSSLTGDSFAPQAETFSRVYACLTPPEPLIVGDIGAVCRRLMRRRLLKMAVRLSGVAVLAAMAWMIWRISRIIVY